MAVHRRSVPGLLENAYQAALAIELAANNFSVIREPTFTGVLPDVVKVGDHRPDLIVDDQVVVEIKSVARYDPVFLRAGAHLSASHQALTSVCSFNFNRRNDFSEGIKRVSL